VWKHPNCRVGYIAQHAFHHIEKHLDESANEYIRWRYQGGMDREEQIKVTSIATEEEIKQMESPFEATFDQEDGSVLKRKVVVESFTERRRDNKAKKVQEYECKLVNGQGNHWIQRPLLVKNGFEKVLKAMDERIAIRATTFARPLTKENVQKHLADVGLAPEFSTHMRIGALSGGQKVKVVLASALWNQPHILILDEPTNYLDRDALGALAMAVKEFGGGVLLITHNCEFADALKEETWNVPGDGKIYVTGNKWGQGKAGKADKVEWDGPQEDTIDALGNIVKFKAPKKKLSRKDIKARQKIRAKKLAEGQDLSTDSDWELDEYIGDTAEKKARPAKEKK